MNRSFNILPGTTEKGVNCPEDHLHQIGEVKVFHKRNETFQKKFVVKEMKNYTKMSGVSYARLSMTTTKPSIKSN